MDRIWLAHYPTGVPHEIDAGAYASLVDVFLQSCARYHDRTAFSSMGGALTYAEVERKSRDFAAYLQRERGLQRGDRLAVMLPNLLQYPVTLFGALRAGLVVVNCNPLYTPRELERQLVDSGATAIVVLENFAHVVAAVAPRTALKTVITTEVGDLLPPIRGLLTSLVVKYGRKMVPPWHIDGAVALRDALSRGRDLALEPVPVGPDDVAFLQYTGGTTGVPKGAMLTHGNLVANLEQISAWMGTDFVPGGEIVVTPLPLYHVFALTVNLLTFVKWGGNNVLIANPRDLPHFVADLAAFPFTVIVGVNTLFNALLNAPGFDRVDCRALKVAIGGGMKVQRAVAERWEARTGRPLIEGYGLTETSPIVTANPVGSAGYTGTVGLPLPSTDVSVRDEAGKELGIGATGELCVRGPQVMAGYWQRPDETAKVMTDDDYLRTGDMGFVAADGQFTLTDRKKDMIVVSGFKVFPNEVEDVVMAHPGVLEVACVGVPDAHSGQAVKIVVLRKDPDLTTAELLAHCRASLTSYKLPRHIQWTNEPLPKSPVGKILRRLVVAEAAQEATHEATTA